MNIKANDPTEEWMQVTYGNTAAQYRKSDELDVTGSDHQSICGTIRKISNLWPHKINALDVGCGSGRYFHCLENVDRLVGLDASQEMLDVARQPVNSEAIKTSSIELICGNFYNADFPKSSFHLIYSLGVFGNGCDLTHALCIKLFEWLAPGGFLFFDTIDPLHLRSGSPIRKNLVASLYQKSPRLLQKLWLKKKGWPPIFLTDRAEIHRVLTVAGFTNVAVESKARHLPSGLGRKLECIARKPLIDHLSK